MTIRLQISQINADPNNNARSLLTGIEELAADIKKNGLLQPLVVVPAPVGSVDSRYQLCAGFRRVAALISLGAKEVDCTVAEGNPDTLNLVENLSREDITIFDYSTGVLKLSEQGLTGRKIADHLIASDATKFGTSTGNINNLIRLRKELAEALIEEWKAGHPAATQKNLLAILGKGRPKDEQVKMWNSMISPAGSEAEGKPDESGEPSDSGNDDVDVIEAPKLKKRTQAQAFKMLEELAQLPKTQLAEKSFACIEATIRWVFGHTDDLLGVNIEGEKRPKKSKK